MPVLDQTVSFQGAVLCESIESRNNLSKFKFTFRGTEDSFLSLERQAVLLDVLELHGESLTFHVKHSFLEHVDPLCHPLSCSLLKFLVEELLHLVLLRCILHSHRTFKEPIKCLTLATILPRVSLSLPVDRLVSLGLMVSVNFFAAPVEPCEQPRTNRVVHVELLGFQEELGVAFVASPLTLVAVPRQDSVP